MLKRLPVTIVASQIVQFHQPKNRMQALPTWLGRLKKLRGFVAAWM